MLKATAAIVPGASVVGTASADEPPRNFNAHLSGDEHGLTREDTLAHGQSNFQLENDLVRFKLVVANIEDIMMAHIHLESVVGPVAVWLHDFDERMPVLVEGRFDGVLSTGTITDDHVDGPIDTVAELVDEIDAGNAFVNVHTLAFPGGEIGGQIHPRN